jgi:O-antigen/teichoic acid export membrane protein
MAQNRYKRLMSNTIIFAIGTFSSKVLVFFMLPFYTNILTTAEYGTVDALINAGQLLIPIASAGINNAVIRFGLEEKNDRSTVFSTGFYTIAVCFLVVALVSPLANYVSFLNGYILLVLAFVLASNFRSLCIQFGLSMGHSKMYAANGIGNTFLNIMLNILFLAGFRWGITGYLLANIVSDIVMGFVMFIPLRMNRYLVPPRSKRLDRALAKAMRKYALPIIPQTICQWIINMSDRYMIVIFINTATNGLYAAANKIPNVLLIVANLFADAWQISAVKESEEKEQIEFYTKVLAAYSSIAFITSSGIIMLSKWVMTFMVAKDYFVAWHYIPVLTMATTFGLLSTFLGSVYMLKLRSKNSMATTVTCAVINISLNFILIRLLGQQSDFMGAMGAGIATLLSYFALFLIRAVDTQRYLKIRWNLPKTVISIVILVAQMLIAVTEAPMWVLWQVVLFALLFGLNVREILLSVKKLLRRA